MNLQKKYAAALELTEKYNQKHLLAYYDFLDDEKKEKLLDAVNGIDFELVSSLYKEASEGASGSGSEDSVAPIPVTVKDELSPEEIEKYEKTGLEIMKKGKFASLTMAGGQGTRLGHSGPKGTYCIWPEGGKSLFEIQCDRLKHMSGICGRTIPWYIMTSVENNDATVRFFEEHGYFGYGKENIMFFPQFMLPMIDFTGKIILENQYTVRLGADGHGGIFRAMAARGVTEDMKKRGAEWIFVGGIDNVLVRLCDPLFVGFLASNNYLLGGKSLIKRDAKEKAGVFCIRNGRADVIEYTEISDEMAEMKDEKGNFVYGDAHILCNMFNISVLEAMGDKGLPYHVAVKKTAYMDTEKDSFSSDDMPVIPDKPNGYKFEAFIFDAFRSYEKMGILRVSREHEFAPVKNKEGEDSPETARALFEACERNGTVL